MRVHIVGCPRSGTTLVTELMRYAFDFAGAADHEQSLFDPIPHDLSPYLTKKPADTIRIGRAFEADENLYVIALVRDPRAVITSVHWSHPDLYFVGFSRWQTYVQHIRRYADHPRYLVIRYEDLLAEPAEQQARIAQLLPQLKQLRDFSNYPDGIEDLHEHAEKALGGIRPFDNTRIDAWRTHLGRVRREYESSPAFQKELEAFGYEANTQWTTSLAEAEPSGESYKDSVDKWPNRWEIRLRYWFKTRRYLDALPKI